jgi:hypothetical protein
VRKYEEMRIIIMQRLEKTERVQVEGTQTTKATPTL